MSDVLSLVSCDSLAADTFPDDPALYTDPAQGDVILQSSDGCNLYVYKFLLTLSSPVFTDMFSMPQPPESDSENDAESEKEAAHADADTPHPIIPVSEDATLLRRLLSWTDPRLLPQIGSLEDIQRLLEVADKYCMTTTIVRIGDTLSYGIHNLCPGGLRSVRVYALAVRYNLASLAQAAARASLDARWEDLMAENGPELAHVPASALHRLQQYRLSCGAAAKKVANDWSWILDATGVVSDCIECASGEPPRHWSKWWVQYMALAADELYRTPSSSTITAPELAVLPLTYMGACNECRRSTGETYKHLARFNKVFIKEIDRAIAEVPFTALQP
ncbi:hypothetical protein MKEN_01408200 [Mycena kentingensis (nom. inval.)]|nr:hypothetical protein MKEN_01408200 [Mycena kentingensis (nom. inval.)]